MKSATELVRDEHGHVIERWTLDPFTIIPDGDGYKQVVSGVTVAVFNRDELEVE
ncbi:MAG: hypothetical protein K6T83_03630 [Alicyclobacillus sp.]|nr:hypothetical protein [Alicyclobacillus sp.]